MAWPFDWKLPADESDFPGNSEERSAAGLAAAGALCNPEDIISDWGDFDGDHSKQQHSDALNGPTVAQYYDSFYPAEELRISDDFLHPQSSD